MKIGKNNYLEISVPSHIEKCEIINYLHSGTWLMESDSKKLNAWKSKIPNGKYEIIGRRGNIYILKCIEKLTN